MRRNPLFLIICALAVGLALGGSSASAATPNHSTCKKLVHGSVSKAEILAYDACRFDKLDAALSALKKPSPSHP